MRNETPNEQPSMRDIQKEAARYNMYLASNGMNPNMVRNMSSTPVPPKNKSMIGTA